MTNSGVNLLTLPGLHRSYLRLLLELLLEQEDTLEQFCSVYHQHISESFNGGMSHREKINKILLNCDGHHIVNNLSLFFPQKFWDVFSAIKESEKRLSTDLPDAENSTFSITSGIYQAFHIEFLENNSGADLSAVLIKGYGFRLVKDLSARVSILSLGMGRLLGDGILEGQECTMTNGGQLLDNGFEIYRSKIIIKLIIIGAEQINIHLTDYRTERQHKEASGYNQPLPNKESSGHNQLLPDCKVRFSGSFIRTRS